MGEHEAGRQATGSYHSFYSVTPDNAWNESLSFGASAVSDSPCLAFQFTDVLI